MSPAKARSPQRHGSVRTDDRLRLLIRCLDQTSLDPGDTPATIESLCGRATRPVPGDPSLSVAAVCVLPQFVPLARELLRGTTVRLAAAAGDFPSASAPIGSRLEEVRLAVREGAEEVDVPMNRAAFLAGRLDEVLRELEGMREAAGTATLKIIIETGELGSVAAIRTAARLATDAGTDFVKTSTGRFAVGATVQAVRSIAETLGQADRRVGVKVSGGIRTTAQALGFVDVVGDTLGSSWLTPELFRVGASSLLDDVVKRLSPRGPT